MNYKIFLVLGGEDEALRPRTKKLLEQISYCEKHSIPFKVILSGFSNFNLSSQNSESSRMRRFLIDKGVNLNNIIIEEESLDTLGNMFFSTKIICSLISSTSNYDFQIILITEGFHMKRSRKLLELVFSACSKLSDINTKNIKILSESANSRGISQYYWKRVTKVIVGRLYALSLKNQMKNVSTLMSNSSLVSKKYILDEILLQVLLFDIKKLKLQSYYDFEMFLFSLPIYSQKYKYKNKMDISKSIYAFLVSSMFENP